MEYSRGGYITHVYGAKPRQLDTSARQAGPAATRRAGWLVLCGIGTVYNLAHPAYGRDWQQDIFAPKCFALESGRNTAFHRMHQHGKAFGGTSDGSLTLVDTDDALLFKLKSASAVSAFPVRLQVMTTSSTSTLKRCSHCRLYYPREWCFNRDRSREDGWRSRCRLCVLRTPRPPTPPVVTAERLRELLTYDAVSGEFRDRATGELVGATGDGYWRIYLDGRSYRAHRLAWLYMTGEWPPCDIDHRDLDRANCRWSNLRLATRGQNNVNTRARADNQLGIKGVWQRPNGKFRARIKTGGKRRDIGTFTTAEEASAAYARAASAAWGEYARAS